MNTFYNIIDEYELLLITTSEGRLLFSTAGNKPVLMTNSIQSGGHDPQTTFSNISSRFSNNSEAFASELLENLEEMFLWCYIYSDMFSKS